MQKPLHLEAIQWMALGVAITNDAFAARLMKHVGPNAFANDLNRYVYGCLEMKLAEIESGDLDTGTENAMTEIGAHRKPGESVPDTLIRILAEQAVESWEHQHADVSERSFTRAERLVKKIQDATSQLLYLAQEDDHNEQLRKQWEEENKREVNERLRLIRQLDKIGKNGAIHSDGPSNTQKHPQSA